MPPTSNPWLWFIGAAFSFLSGLGLKDVIVAIFKRKPRQAVEVTNQIDLAAAARAQVEAARQYAQEIEEDARQARASAQEAWRLVDQANTRVEEANNKLVRVTRKLDDSTWKLEVAARYMDGILAKIWEPTSDIEMVRAWVRSQPPPPIPRSNSNGNSH